jgi:S-adenosylmethionine/arginine decarboxylase-like enzyme
MDHLNHIHLLVTAWVDAPPMTADAGTDWLRELVDIIDMQILMDAKAIYCEDLGNEGVTGIVGLTTSHASFHSWHDAPRPFINIDVYSCRSFSTDAVMEHLRSVWGMTEASFMLIDREDGKNEVLANGRQTF